MIDNFYSYINKDKLEKPDFCCVWDIFNKTDYNIKMKLNNIIDSNNFETTEIKIMYNQYKNRKHSNVYECYLNKIKNVSNKYELKVLMLDLTLKKLIDSPFLISNNNTQSVSINNTKSVSNNILCYNVGNLGLNNKEYYLNFEFKQIKNYYLKLIKKLLGNHSNYMKIYNFEYEIAKIINKKPEIVEMNSQDFIMEFNNIYLFNNINHILIENYELLKFINNYIETNFNNFKEYLLWNYIYLNYGLISEENEEYKFNNLTKYMLGTNIMYPLWYRTINYLDNISIFSEILGYYYSINNTHSVINNNILIDILKLIIPEFIIFINRIENNENKNRILDKIKNLKIKIKHNNTHSVNNIKKYNISITDDFFTNHINLNYCSSLLNLNNSNLIQPHHINAIYSPINNEIILPLSLFQYENFNNFIILSFIIAHEITHCFDSIGIKYDYLGKYNSNIILNEEIYNQLITSFNKNIINELYADIIGLKISFNAFKKYLKKYDSDDLKEFFIKFTKLWNINITNEEYRRRQLMDTHPLHIDRVNIALSYIEEFYELYNS
jgi:predicted metalloendopeptidase